MIQLIKHIVLSFFFVMLAGKTIHAQHLVRGRVADADNQNPLAAANIQIENTFQGTITNEDGIFTLPVDRFPATLIISYIGYESQKRLIQEPAPAPLSIYLKPIILEMDAIVIIAEDPAMAIMRKVIRQKQIWRKSLDNYRADAYSRLVFENDSGIVSISESLSEIYWDKTKGSREIIKSKRQTNNLSEGQNMAFASFIPNFYDDDIEIIGFKVIGPTHPDALDYYDFKLLKERRLDNKTVFDIQVIPAGKLQPTFEGTLAVLDEDFAVIDAALTPGASIRFPMPIQELNLFYHQQFRNYGGKVWLPVDFRANGTVKIGLTGLQFPAIKYKRVTAFTDFDINTILPDSIFQEENVVRIDSVSVKNDTLFTEKKVMVPLTREEEVAYDGLDSTLTLEKAFKPTGFLADMLEFTADGSEDDTTGSFNLLSVFSPQLWFNRVDGFHAGLDIRYRPIDPLMLRMGAGYKTGSKRWEYSGSVTFDFGPNKRWQGEIAYHHGTLPRSESQTYSLLFASFPALFGRADYFDYFLRDGIQAGLTYYFKEIRSRFGIGFISEDHRSLTKTTDYNLFGNDYVQRDNPLIQPGVLRSFKIHLQYGSRDYIPFGFVGQKRIKLEIEHSDPIIVSSDFTFTRYGLEADWHIPTYLTRRLLPNALDIHLSASYATGTLPLQRFGSIDGSLEYFTPYPVLKTRRGRPYEGEKHFLLYWEHNFRTVPFELINFDFLVDKGIGIIIFGGHGRTWISDQRMTELTFTPVYTDKFHHELGISVNGIFSLLRIDTAFRLESGTTYVGFSFARFF
ncbi:MAG: carboxypeptidase-like regulatory domain-containing protein [Calditrichales bacterium]|nr:MAG: carboxypeptidase-like regulatory domain-containing protein [Calditrichales bacterium]